MDNIILAAQTVTISKQLLDDCPPIDWAGILSGRVTLPPAPPEPVAALELVPGVVSLAAGEAELLTARCLCGHLEAVHNHDDEWGDTCALCRCTDYRHR